MAQGFLSLHQLQSLHLLHLLLLSPVSQQLQRLPVRHQLLQQTQLRILRTCSSVNATPIKETAIMRVPCDDLSFQSPCFKGRVKRFVKYYARLGKLRRTNSLLNRIWRVVRTDYCDMMLVSISHSQQWPDVRRAGRDLTRLPGKFPLCESVLTRCCRGWRKWRSKAGTTLKLL